MLLVFVVEEKSQIYPRCKLDISDMSGQECWR